MCIRDSNNFGCASVEEIIDACTVSTNDHHLESVQVYPNPVIGQLTISAQAPTEYSILSGNGTFVLQNGLLKEGDNIIEMGTLESGLYIVKVGNDNLRILKL